MGGLWDERRTWEVRVSTFVKRIGLAVLAVAGFLAAASAGLGLILRYQPSPLMKPARWFAGRVLNPPVLWYVQRFGRTSQPLVYHRGRRTGNEYVTPLCMVSTDEGFIVPAAFGPEVDWMANLRVTPESRVVFQGETHETVAEVIDLDRAIAYAGGKPGCPCWTQFNVEHLVILRPIDRAA
jgi:deazaflavin-dependent oxidoreductase (nitroreductase family)